MTADGMPIASMYRSTAGQLTDPMADFLARQPFVMLATHNADGSIHLVPAWYLFEDGRFFIATWSHSRKARNVAARPQVTVTVDDRDTAEWVSATGTAELVRGQQAARINDRLHRRYMTEDGIETVGPLFQQAEDVTIAVAPHKWKAWDFQSTMLTGFQQAGVAVDEAPAWFLPSGTRGA